VTWATAAEVLEQYPLLTEDDLVGLAALGRLTWRPAPIYTAGVLVGAATLYDISEVPILLAESAVTELRAGKRVEELT
jgi:hypothetical protein